MRPRRPVDVTLWQPPRVPYGGDTAGRRRALGHGADVRAGRDHPGPLAGARVGQPVGPAAPQGGQRLHVPQPSAPVSGNQGSAHEDRIRLHLHRTSQRISEYCDYNVNTYVGSLEVYYRRLPRDLGVGLVTVFQRLV